MGKPTVHSLNQVVPHNEANNNQQPEQLYYGGNGGVGEENSSHASSDTSQGSFKDMLKKRFGYSIKDVIVMFGWIGFSPFVYVDTSEMWLAPKWQRVWVSLSGPFTHFILAGISIWIGHTSSLPSVTMTCWAFALISYLGMLINLNPLLELDGYYALSDALEKPNLKTQCSTWFKNLFLKRQFQMTKIEAIYFGWAVLNLMLCVLCLIIQSDYLNRMF